MDLLINTIKNNIKEVRELLKDNCDVNYKSKYGESALIIATYLNHYEIFKMLLKYKLGLFYRKNHKTVIFDYIQVKIDDTDLYDNTALIYACKNNNYKMVKRLIKAGADINKKNKLNLTAIFYACLYGFTKIVKLLIDKTESDMIEEFFIACEYNHRSVVRLILWRRQIITIELKKPIKTGLNLEKEIKYNLCKKMITIYVIKNMNYIYYDKNLNEIIKSYLF